MPFRMTTRQQYQNGQIKLRRDLDGLGEILVERGQAVLPDTPIGQRTLADNFVVIDVAQDLGVTPERPDIGIDVGPYLRKSEGDVVEEGECLAERYVWRNVGPRRCFSPTQGRVAAVEGRWLIVEIATTPEVMHAFVPGFIVDIEMGLAATVATFGTYIEATFGVGGEAQGTLFCATEDLEADIDLESIEQAPPGSVLFAGGTIERQALPLLETADISAVIVGSLDADLLNEIFMLATPFIITEGFGRLSMHPETWQLLVNNRSLMTYVSCPSQLQTQSSRAKIIIPDDTESLDLAAFLEKKTSLPYAAVGDRVRNIRAPNPMAWGTIAAVQDRPQATLSLVHYWGADVHFDHGLQFVPWFNLEKFT
ncbi:MAG: hypothetical protein AAF629_02175 [Chloroflexota bacterium]